MHAAKATKEHFVFGGAFKKVIFFLGERAVGENEFEKRPLQMKLVQAQCFCHKTKQIRPGVPGFRQPVLKPPRGVSYEGKPNADSEVLIKEEVGSLFLRPRGLGGEGVTGYEQRFL